MPPQKATVRFAPDCPERHLQIAAHALRNAFRHAHAWRLEVEIRSEGEHIRLRVATMAK
jgi:nitrate/nitrite-specific signal transduction histidine kinase